MAAQGAMKSLPEDLAHYKSTPEFAEGNIPAGLLRSHSTAAGGGLFKLIEPQAKHEVAAIGAVRFCVKFHRK